MERELKGAVRNRVKSQAIEGPRESERHRRSGCSDRQ